MKLLSIVLIACLLLLGCDRQRRAQNAALEVKVEDWQTAQAVGASDRLREVFNSSACAPIYGAASAYFKTQSSFDWDTECERLKLQLGSWRSFQMTSAQRCGEGIVCIHGPAQFEKGRKEMDVAWLLTQHGPQLEWIALKENEQHWKQIPPRPWLYKLMDPIPIKVTKNGGQPS
jgi:hypothetical protein